LIGGLRAFTPPWLALSITLGLVLVAPGNFIIAKANLQAGVQVTSAWLWANSSKVTQRYGCTTFSGEDAAPAGWCPAGFSYWHHGIDISDDLNQPNPNVGCTSPYNTLPSGQGSPLYADGLGTVIQAGTTSYGTIVEWQRDSDGYYIVLYHTQSIQVHTGDRLYKGKPLAYVGNSGFPTYSTACHLHFEVRKPPAGYWDDLDPSPFLGNTPFLGRSPSYDWPSQNVGGTLNVLQQGQDTSIKSDSQSTPASTIWSGWTGLGGSLGSEPSSGLYSNVIGVFARGPALPDQVWYDEQVPFTSNWTGWQPLGGLTQGRPASASTKDGEPAVFALGQGGNPSMWWQYRKIDGTWSGWLPLGGGLVSDPAVAFNQDGTIEVFAEGPTGAVWYDKEAVPNGTTWSGWAPVSGGILFVPAKPAVGRNTDGTLQVFGLGPANGTIWTARQPAPSNNNWSSWASLPNGSLATDPSVAPTADGSLDVFALGPTQATWSDKQTSAGSSTWTGWTNVGDTGYSVPTAILNTDGTLSIFVVVNVAPGYCAAVDTAFEIGANGTAWSSWQGLGCP